MHIVNKECSLITNWACALSNVLKYRIGSVIFFRGLLTATVMQIHTTCRVQLLTLYVLLLTNICSSSRFLVVLTLGEHGSHRLTTAVVIEQLLERGHNVTLLVPVDESQNVKIVNDKLTRIEFESSSIYGMRHLLNKMVRSAMQSDRDQELTEYKIFGEVRNITDALCEELLSDDFLMQNLRSSNFDLMFADLSFVCPVLIAQNLDIHYVTLTTSLVPSFNYHSNACPVNPSYMAELMSGYSHQMNFYQRITNSLFTVMISIASNFLLLGSENLKLKYDIKPEVSTYKSLGKAEIWFINSHFALDYPRPLMPHSIHVGGLTAKPRKPLNQDLENFMQTSGDYGVIVFSLGSYVNELEEKKAEVIAEAFASLPQKIIWKQGGTLIKNIPSNVRVMKWMAQNDILGHEKTKLFVSHCGLNSAFEALYHAVPIVCIPIFADQFDVAARVVSKGIGLQVNFKTLSTEQLEDTLTTVLINGQFQDNMNHLSAIYRDEPLMPAERVAYWMEYTVRHNGTAHLKSPALDLNFFQYYLLDVIAALITGFIIFIAVLFQCCSLIYRRCKGRKIKNE